MLLSIASAAANPVGVAPPLANLPLGTPITGSRTTHQFTAIRVANRPSAFVLRNFLSEAECAAIVAEAEESGKLHRAETNGRTDARKKCDICCLGLGSSVVSSLTREAAELLLDERALALPGAGCEDLHVLRYEPGGEFQLHYDATSVTLPRVLTVLYYLNGVGATWFPFADDDSRPQSWFGRREDVLAHAASLKPTSGDGLLVEPLHVGDALAFFNFVEDVAEYGNNRARRVSPEPYAMHAGLPVEAGQTKWLASHFFRAPGLVAE